MSERRGGDAGSSPRSAAPAKISPTAKQVVPRRVHGNGDDRPRASIDPRRDLSRREWEIIYDLHRGVEAQERIGLADLAAGGWSV